MQVQKLNEYYSYLEAIRPQTSAQLEKLAHDQSKLQQKSTESLKQRLWAQRLPQTTSPEVLQAIEDLPEENSKYRISNIITGNYIPLGYQGQTQSSLLLQVPEPRGLLKLVLDMVKEIKELLEKGSYKNSVHRFYQHDAEVGLTEALVNLESFAENLHQIIEATKPQRPMNIDFLAKPQKVSQESLNLRL